MSTCFVTQAAPHVDPSRPVGPRHYIASPDLERAGDSSAIPTCDRCETTPTAGPTRWPGLDPQPCQFHEVPEIGEDESNSA